MSTSPGSGSPDDRPPLEPVRVMRLRRTDALAELIREMQDGRDFESVTLPGAPAGAAAEDDTEELPQVPGAGRRARSGGTERAGEAWPVTGGRADAGPGTDRLVTDRRSGQRPSRQRPSGERWSGARPGLGRGQRRAAAVIAVGAAAVIGFGCALLLPGRTDAATAPSPGTSAGAEPTPVATPTGSLPVDPDGAGTLREGDSGPEVTDLQRRLLRIPNVYENGSTAGTYDATLTEAVARFQLWYGVRGDENGVYGDDTRQSLESRTP
ncbi:peptidoglycan-binding protein [Streptomyces griseoviridis]